MVQRKGVAFLGDRQCALQNVLQEITESGDMEAFRYGKKEAMAKCKRVDTAG
jgi:hypothetical protein